MSVEEIIARIDRLYGYLRKGGDHQKFLNGLEEAELLLPRLLKTAENALSMYVDSTLLYDERWKPLIRSLQSKVKRCSICNIHYTKFCLCGRTDTKYIVPQEEYRLNARVREVKTMINKVEMDNKEKRIERWMVLCNYKSPELDAKRSEMLVEMGVQNNWPNGPITMTRDLAAVKKDLDNAQKEIIEMEDKLRQVKEKEKKFLDEYEKLMIETQVDVLNQCD